MGGRKGSPVVGLAREGQVRILTCPAGDTAAWRGLLCLLPYLGPECHDRPHEVTLVDQRPVHRDCSKIRH